MTTIPRPDAWEVDPDEYYGKGTDGMDYYRVKNDVYRTANGYTSWVCTVACWGHEPSRRYFMGV